MRGYKNNQAKWISGLFDSESNNPRKVWVEMKEFYKDDFDGEFTILAFNKVESDED